jgi:hypothetical protein
MIRHLLLFSSCTSTACKLQEAEGIRAAAGLTNFPFFFLGSELHISSCGPNPTRPNTNTRRLSGLGREQRPGRYGEASVTVLLIPCGVQKNTA